MPHFRSIHYLRGLAAVMVVVLHVFTNSPHMVDRADSVLWLQGGVDLFFVISGFVMVHTTAGRAVHPAAFVRQRAARIVPMYWIATLAVIAEVQGQWMFKLASLAFVPMLNPAVGMMQPVLEPGWTINYEMFFYALFAATLWLGERWRLPVMAAVLLGLVAVAGLFGGPTGPKGADTLLQFYGRPIVIEFLLGMVIARYRISLPGWAVPLGLCAMIAAAPLGIDRLFAFGLPAALIVAGALHMERRLPHWRIPHLLGSASYSIYLFHLPALSFAGLGWTIPGMSVPLFAVMAPLFMIGVGCIMHFALERPIAAWLAQRRPRTLPAAA